ncbi:MAG: 3-oxo-tetronate kinase [Pseudomonadota bacterium]
MRKADNTAAPSFGALADDLTGAADLALLLAQSGIATALLPGPLISPEAGDEALVVARKIRAIDPERAVAEALQVASWLGQQSVTHLYFKYCSTFDSTPAGNIGPVTDALLTGAKQRATVMVPAFPDNGRTVCHGYLFVDGVLLSESALARHPANPMTDAKLTRWLDRQTPSLRAATIHYADVVAGPEKLSLAIDRAISAGARALIVDTLSNADLDTIARCVAAEPLATGGSAFGAALARQIYGRPAAAAAFASKPETSGPTAILAGSCSPATRRQLRALDPAIPRFVLDPVAPDREITAQTTAILDALNAPVVVIHTPNDSAALARATEALGEDAGRRAERLLAGAALRLSQRGVRRFIVAGGETSSAVGEALSLPGLRVVERIAEGVPWLGTAGDDPTIIAFKSGNFGDDDFFEAALTRLQR